MKARVSITLDPHVHRQAKRIARSRRTTVSGLIETFLRSTSSPVSGSLVDQMIGSAKLRAPAPGADPLYDALKARYLEP